MELRLEITGVKTLTPQQREAIQQKLVEIKDIAKNKEAKAENRSKAIEKAFNKLRYESEKYKENWLKKTGQEIITLDELYAKGITPQQYRSLKNRGHIIVVMRGLAGYRPTLIDANSPYFHR